MRIKAHHISVRFLLAMAMAAIVALCLPSSVQLATRLICAWDAAMACLLFLTWWTMLRATPTTMRRAAQQEDVSRLVIFTLVTVASCASVLAIAFLLQDSKHLTPSLLSMHLILSFATIIGAWLLVHTIFAVHYAHGYYQDESKSLQQAQAEELDFPGEVDPDYWDFLYFSFVIGMTSQVSDVEISSRSLRRLALLHGILSFFFNTTILAMSINIVAGLIQGIATL